MNPKSNANAVWLNGNIGICNDEIEESEILESITCPIEREENAPNTRDKHAETKEIIIISKIIWAAI